VEKKIRWDIHVLSGGNKVWRANKTKEEIEDVLPIPRNNMLSLNLVLP